MSDQRAQAAEDAHHPTKLILSGGRFMKDKDRSDIKKKYDAPAVTQISLRPEEAVLGHCKTVGVGGPGGGNCTHIGSCMTIGS